MTRKPGFTLLEIIIVICLISTLFAVTASVFSGILLLCQLNSTVKIVQSDLCYAQNKAMSSGRTVLIRFSTTDPNSYVLETHDPFSGKTIRLAKKLLPGSIHLVRDKTISFSSSGFPPPGGSGTVSIKDPFGRARKIVISSSGRIRTE